MQTFRTSLGSLTTWMTTKVAPQAKALTPNALQLTGVALFDVGCFTLATWLGFMVAGALVALIGWSADK